jgi:hypothetical protein
MKTGGVSVNWVFNWYYKFPFLLLERDEEMLRCRSGMLVPKVRGAKAGEHKVRPYYWLILLVPKLQLGNAIITYEAPASCLLAFVKLELQNMSARSQAGA